DPKTDTPFYTGSGPTLAPLGSKAQDSATVTVTSNGNPVTHGTVDFQFFGPDGLIDDSTADVDSNGTATDPFISRPLPAGDYYFVAGYSDGNDFGESQSDSEPFTILKGGGGTAAQVATQVEVTGTFTGDPKQVAIYQIYISDPAAFSATTSNSY